MNLNIKHAISYLIILFSCPIYPAVAHIKKDYVYSGVIPYTYHHDRMYILLGEEYRSDNWVWCDFGGKPEPRDNGESWQTALREFYEETARSITLVPDYEKYMGQCRGKRVIRYYLPVYYGDASKIKLNADAMRAKGPKPTHIEKRNWQWVDAQDLLDKRTGLHIWYRFQKTIHKDKNLIKSLIEKAKISGK